MDWEFSTILLGRDLTKQVRDDAEMAVFVEKIAVIKMESDSALLWNGHDYNSGFLDMVCNKCRGLD